VSPNSGLRNLICAASSFWAYDPVFVDSQFEGNVSTFA
jgi:hypothetical protein